MNRISSGMVAEFLGTFALVFFGAGSIIVSSGSIQDAPIVPGGTGLVAIALAHALALFVFITGSMYISGGQLNPAVSVGLVIAGKQPLPRAAAFIVAQLIGAACGAGMLQFLLGPEVANMYGANLGATIGRFTELGNTKAVFGLEAIMTFALVFVVLTTAVDERSHKLGGLAIGLTVGMCILFGGPLTGASMNPARTFGPAICGHHWDMHAIYWAAPLVGAALAAIVYRFFWDQPKR